MADAPAAQEVLARREGAVGRITLNRPKALHALTTSMCEAMSAALLEWRDDPAVHLQRVFEEVGGATRPSRPW